MSNGESVTNEWPKQDFVFTNGSYEVETINWCKEEVRRKKDKRIVCQVVNEWPMNDQKQVFVFTNGSYEVENIKWNTRSEENNQLKHVFMS